MVKYFDIRMHVAKLNLVKACSNEANMLVHHHSTLLNATCWPRLNTVLVLSLNLFKIFVHNGTTVLGQQCCMHNVGFVSTGVKNNKIQKISRIM